VTTLELIKGLQMFQGWKDVSVLIDPDYEVEAGDILDIHSIKDEGGYPVIVTVVQ
jgi:hypothetical protein